MSYSDAFDDEAASDHEVVRVLPALTLSDDVASAPVPKDSVVTGTAVTAADLEEVRRAAQSTKR